MLRARPSTGSFGTFTEPIIVLLTWLITAVSGYLVGSCVSVSSLTQAGEKLYSNSSGPGKQEPMFAILASAGTSRRSRRKKQKSEEDRAALRQRTEDEIDQIHAEYWAKAEQHRNWAVGAAYARYSTRFQESIGDQIRSLLEYALANQIRIPRKLIFFDLAVRGAKNRRAGLDGVRQTLISKKASALLLFATNRLFRKT